MTPELRKKIERRLLILSRLESALGEFTRLIDSHQAMIGVKEEEPSPQVSNDAPEAPGLLIERRLRNALEQLEKIVKEHGEISDEILALASQEISKLCEK